MLLQKLLSIKLIDFRTSHIVEKVKMDIFTLSSIMLWFQRKESHLLNKVQASSFWSPSESDTTFTITGIFFLIKHVLFSSEIVKAHISILNTERNTILLCRSTPYVMKNKIGVMKYPQKAF